MFAPIYRRGEPRDTAAERRRNLAGYALGVFRVGDLVSAAFRSDPSRNGGPAKFDLYIYDGDGNGRERQLHVHYARAGGAEAPILAERQVLSGPHFKRSFDVGGRTWTVVAKPLDPEFGRATARQPWMALIAVLAFTGMLAVYLVSAINRTRAVVRLVDERTGELKREVADRRRAEEASRQSETRIRAVLENVVDGIITIDARGVIESINPAAERIFGHAREEIVGRNVGALMPEPYGSEHDGYLENYLETGRAGIIGVLREVEGRRKDGGTFPLELAVSEMNLGEKRMFTGIVRDITERKKIDRMKNEFISTVSHELRTPLTSIMGSLGLIRSGVAGEISDKGRAMIDIAYNNTDRLVRLINDILDIEKIESGRMDFTFTPIDLGGLVLQCVEANRAFGEELGVHITARGGFPDVLVDGDYDRLVQVLTNLLSNAAKFSPPGGEVVVSGRVEDGAVRVSVADHGPGIPDEFHDRIFGKFAQADSSDAREKGGTGLGLSITKAIVEKHGGTIEFDSEIGKGTTFHFLLPIWREEARRSGARDDSRHRVLVCEDDRDVARLLKIMLEEGGLGVDVAYDAAQAKRMLAEAGYAALTVDLDLPGQTGISLIRELRDAEPTRGIPIIVISAYVDRGSKELNGDAVGVIDWMAKPIDPERLLRGIGIAIRQHGNGRPRILHVEDDPDVREVVSTITRDIAEVTAANDLRAAKGLLERESFDLVLLDLLLPDGDGEDLLPLLRRPGKPATPVIVFSVKEMSRDSAQRVAAALVKSQTSNADLLATVRSLLDVGAAGRSGSNSTESEERCDA